jgi:predicted ATPase
LVEHPAYSNFGFSVVAGIISSIIVSLLVIRWENQRAIAQSLYELHMELSILRNEINNAIQTGDASEFVKLINRDTYPTHMKLYGIKLSKSVDEKIKQANLAVSEAQNVVNSGKTTKVDLIRIKTSLFNASLKIISKK